MKQNLRPQAWRDSRAKSPAVTPVRAPTVAPERMSATSLGASLGFLFFEGLGFRAERFGFGAVGSSKDIGLKYRP